MLRVGDIAAAAVATGRISLDEFVRVSWIRSKVSNVHFAKYARMDKGIGADIRLAYDLNEPVYGDFFTLWYWHPIHRNIIILTERVSLKETEETIVGHGGVLNTFTDFFLAFVEGKHAAYEVRNPAGELLAVGGRRVCSSDVAHATQMSDRLVKWNVE